MQTLDVGHLPNPNRICDSESVEGKVSAIAKMMADSKVSNHRIHRTLSIQCNGSGVELLDEAPNSQDLSCYFKLLLYRINGVNRGLRVIVAAKIPAVEAREIL